MLKTKSLLIFVLVLAAFLFIFSGCGDPVDPYEHMGPDEKEEMEQDAEDDGYGSLVDFTVKFSVS